MTEGMRFYVEQLLSKEFYMPLPTRNKSAYHFRDYETEALEIHSPDPDPWAKPWVVTLSEYEGYTEEMEYPHILILTLSIPKLFSGFSCSIEREVQRSFYARSIRPSTYFFSFISDRTRLGYIPYWINYTFQAKSPDENLG